MRISKRVQNISLSPTLALDARAKALAARGRDIINMAVGEPDFEVPRVVADAACEAVRTGRTRYTPAAGETALRSAIAAYLRETRGCEFASEHVTVCHSAKHALSGTVLTLVDEGDEILVPLPAWVSYIEQIRYAGGEAVLVPSRGDCGPDLDAMVRAITPRTRGVMINSPSNPTGYVLTREEVSGIASIALEHDLWILSDEIYQRLVYVGEGAFSPVSLGAAERARTVIIDGASKAYAMTGFRIGFVAASPEVAHSVARLHSHLTGCPNSISQHAYRAALEHEPEEVGRMCREFDRRRRYLCQKLREMGLDLPEPRGAFYAFPRVDPWLDERGSSGLCEDLLESQNLALVPGSAFGDDRCVRLSYATSMEKIEVAVERLAQFLGDRTRLRA